MRNREKVLALSLLAVVLILGAIGLAPELSISRVDLNDNAFHYPLIADMIRQMERGGNPFDWWAPEWCLGYPVLRTYQPLAHFLVALTYFALLKNISLMTVFVWVRFLSVALLPLTFFLTARLLSFSWLTSAAAAMLAPLISTNGLYGIEYGSYLWAGSGLFTQAVACHFLLLAIGFGYRAIRRGSSFAIAGILLGLTFLAHFIYGYMDALTLCLIAVLPDRRLKTIARIARVAPAARIAGVVMIGAVALALSAFELLPLLLDSRFINHSRWEPPWKWDSFGAAQALKLLFTGELLDHGRLPMLSLLALAGAAVYAFDVRKHGWRYPARTLAVCGAALWILLLFGRPFWGPLLMLLGVSQDMQLHRVIGGAQIFLIFLAALGLAAIWRALARRTHAAVAVAVTAILFYPMVRERARYLSNDRVWGEKNLAAYNANRLAIDSAIAVARDRGGRAYAGLAASWGGQFKIGDAPFYAFLSEARVPALSFMYHSMSLTSEIMTRFDQFSEAHFRLFNLRTVVAPSGVDLPAFLTPIVDSGPLRILGAPDSGYFDVVDVPYAVRTSKENFYDVNDRWLQSEWVGNRQHLLLDFDNDAPPPMPRLSPDDPLPVSRFSYPGVAVDEGRNDQAYDADVAAARPSYVLFKMTWHPNWKATVDGAPVPTAMLSPGFVGVPISAGRHKIELRYEPEKWESALAIAGVLMVLLIGIGERRGLVPRFDFTLPRLTGHAWARPALGLTALALPVCVSLLTSRLPEGHDATEYLPRLVEFHQNIAHWILLPRWAPDLSRGAGQPLFLFNPPFLYYLSEFWHLLGYGFAASLNLASVAIVLSSTAGMFLLGRLYFGETGGWLAAAALLYAPYFAVDLYVRSALAEFSAFPFFAFALFGFGAYAKYGARKYLLTGAAAFAGVLLCHNPAALLFAPLLGLFILFSAWMARSSKLLLAQICGATLGLALAAFVWIPSLADRPYVQLESVLQGYSQYTNHFVYLHQLFDSPWGYGISVPGDRDGMSFALGATHLVLIALACLWAARHRSRWTWFFFAAALAMTWMTLSSTQPLWDHLRMLQYIAFPWRWLGPAAVCLAMLVAALGPAIDSLNRRNAAFAGALALLIAPNLSHLAPVSFRDVDPALWTPHEIAARGIEASALDEYRTRWMRDVPPYDPRPARIVFGNAEYRETAHGPVYRAAAITAVETTVFELPLAWFPGFQVRIDGAPANAWPSGGDGLMRFQVPPGRHLATIQWTGTPALWIADGISLLALAVFLAAALPRRRLQPRSPEFTAAVPARTQPIR